MDETHWAGALELLVFYGGAFAFGGYQLWSLKKMQREDEAKAAQTSREDDEQQG